MSSKLLDDRKLSLSSVSCLKDNFVSKGSLNKCSYTKSQTEFNRNSSKRELVNKELAKAPIKSSPSKKRVTKSKEQVIACGDSLISVKFKVNVKNEKQSSSLHFHPLGKCVSSNRLQCSQPVPNTTFQNSAKTMVPSKRDSDSRVSSVSSVQLMKKGRRSTAKNSCASLSSSPISAKASSNMHSTPTKKSISKEKKLDILKAGLNRLFDQRRLNASSHEPKIPKIPTHNSNHNKPIPCASNSPNGVKPTSHDVTVDYRLTNQSTNTPSSVTENMDVEMEDVSESLEFLTNMEIDLPNPNSDEQNCYIVVDTNVLLGHLKFLDVLKDCSLLGYGQVSLYIPWKVIQELDKQKSDVSLSRKAVPAIRYLHSVFGSRHPRFCGQSAKMAALCYHPVYSRNTTYPGLTNLCG